MKKENGIMNKKLENLVKIWEESKFKVICRDVFDAK